MAEQVYGFGKDDVGRIGEVVRRVEKQPYRGTPVTQRPTVWNPGVIEAIVTSPISACNGTTPGIGQAQPYITTYNSNTNTFSAAPDYSYANTNSNSVLVANWSQNSNTIAVNTHVLIGWRNGHFIFVSGDC
jgi:hypothetical protein